MDEVRKELDAAYRLLSHIAVSGDAVDFMAAARNTLRKLDAELQKMGGKEVKEDA